MKHANNSNKTHRKHITKLVFRANLLANALTKKTKQHRKIHNSIYLNN